MGEAATQGLGDCSTRAPPRMKRSSSRRFGPSSIVSETVQTLSPRLLCLLEWPDAAKAGRFLASCPWPATTSIAEAPSRGWQPSQPTNQGGTGRLPHFDRVPAPSARHGGDEARRHDHRRGLGASGQARARLRSPKADDLVGLQGVRWPQPLESREDIGLHRCEWLRV